MRRFFLCSLFLSALFVGVELAEAQCAMCKLNAESATADSKTKAEGVNFGILYLLSAPYLGTGILGYIWYKKFRKGKKKTN